MRRRTGDRGDTPAAAFGGRAKWDVNWGPRVCVRGYVDGVTLDLHGAPRVRIGSITAHVPFRRSTHLELVVAGSDSDDDDTVGSSCTHDPGTAAEVVSTLAYEIGAGRW